MESRSIGTTNPGIPAAPGGRRSPGGDGPPAAITDSFTPSRDGRNAEDLGKAARVLLQQNLSTPELLWKIPTEGAFFIEPEIDPDGTIFTGGSRAIVAVDSATGNEKWRFPAASGELSATDMAKGDAGVYVGSRDGRVISLDKATGKERWSYPVTSHRDLFVTMGPDETVVTGNADDRLIAIDGRTGKKRWEFKADGLIHNAPGVAPDGTLYFSSYGKIYAVDGVTGKEKWRRKVDDAGYTTPSVSPKGLVYFGSNKNGPNDYYAGEIVAVDGRTGDEKWRYDAGNGIYGELSVLPDGGVVAGCYNSHIIAVDGDTGKEKWKHRTRFVNCYHSKPVVDRNGVVYLSGYDNRLLALDGTKGERRWDFDAGGQGSRIPALDSRGAIYFQGPDALVALRPPAANLKQAEERAEKDGVKPTITEKGNQVEIDGVKLPVKERFPG